MTKKKQQEEIVVEEVAVAPKPKKEMTKAELTQFNKTDKPKERMTTAELAQFNKTERGPRTKTPTITARGPQTKTPTITAKGPQTKTPTITAKGPQTKTPTIIKPKAKKVAKKKVFKPTNVNTGDAAYIPSWVKRKEWDGKSQDDLYKETQKTKDAPKTKKAAAPSKAQIDKGGAFGPKDEQTADFKDFLSKHGGVKGFQFNLVGKNKTKAEGMKLARESYKREQDDRYEDKELKVEKDKYKYGPKRRLVKKKGGAMRKAQGGTIRLKTGGAVIDTYDYN